MTQIYSTMMHKVNIFQPTRILTSTNAIDVQEWARECLERGERKLLIDFRNVFFIDSSGLGALLAIHKMTKAYGGELALCCIQGQARMLFEMTSTSHFFSIYTDQSEFEHQLHLSSQ